VSDPVPPELELDKSIPMLDAEVEVILRAWTFCAGLVNLLLCGVAVFSSLELDEMPLAVANGVLPFHDKRSKKGRMMCIL
jgi:hypothetical protein